MSCPQCFTGHVNPDTPKGKVETLHGLPTYVAQPKNGQQAKGIIVVVPDAFGWEFVNNRILADHYADAGDYKVYVPDFMNGNAAPVWMIKSMGMLFGQASIFTKIYNGMWVARAFLPFAILNRPSVAYPRVTSFFQAVREKEGSALPVGAAGFCWGGLHIVKLAHGEKAPNGKPLVDACFAAHPSNVAVPADVEKIVKPVAFAVGDKDFVMNMKQVQEVKKLWAGMQDKVETEVTIYPGAGHGFAVRADSHLQDAVRQATEAEEQAISWFKKHFAKVKY